MLTSKHPSVLNYKARYERHAMPILKKTWMEYWNFMMERYTWADTHFVQGTAFMLGIDVWIVTTKSKSNNPYTKTLSDMNTPQNPGIAPPMILGLKGESHYQSLLTTEENTPNKYDSQKNLTYAEVVMERTTSGQPKKVNEDRNESKGNFFKETTSSEKERRMIPK